MLENPKIPTKVVGSQVPAAAVAVQQSCTWISVAGWTPCAQLQGPAVM